MNVVCKHFKDLSNTQLYEILKSRAKIFIEEQKMLYCDLDDIDYDAIHVFSMEDNKVIAYMRIFYKESDIIQFGRVLTLRHNCGIGHVFLSKALLYIKNDLKPKKIFIESQKHAIHFYEEFGFKVISDEFFENGIPHVNMELSI